MIIAIVGATGLVGREILKILDQKNFLENNDVFLYASKRSQNKKLKINNKKFVVRTLCEQHLENNYDYVFFSAGKEISLKWANEFVKRGAVVIDNSSAFRRDKNIPLVVPEINGENSINSNIIANPNCSTIGVSVPLYAISKIYKIKKVIISTYQAVSGAGQKGKDDLKFKTSKKFPYVIYNNLIPQIDNGLENNYTYEEDKMDYELKRILNEDEILVSATCVRVPISNCHSESVFVEFDEIVDIGKIKNTLKVQEGMMVFDNLNQDIYPMPIIANERNEIFVGRLRYGDSSKRSITFFISFDNIRKGAGLNAVQIMECILNQKLNLKQFITNMSANC